LLGWLLARYVGEKTASRTISWLVMLALLVAAYELAIIFDAQVKVSDWLLWRYAPLWPCCAFFALACVVVGNLIVAYLLPDQGPASGGLAEAFTLRFATGLYAFYVALTLVGFGRGLGAISFWAVPLGLIALGGRRALREWKHLRPRYDTEGDWLRFSPAEVAAFGVGAVALAFLYLGVLVPDNTAYDARWYHLGLAEHYAAAGGIIRSPEGAVPSTVSHLASVLYAWGFCLPWGTLFDRLELCAHLEFTVLVCTLPGIVALTRHLLPSARARGAWLFFFAFPSVFLYDSSLHSAADHIAAVWAVPAYLVAIRAAQDLRPRTCVLLAIQLAGLLMTKYTAAITVIGPALVVVIVALWLGARQLAHRPRRFLALGALATLAGSGLLLTTPHWLKNLIWYGDPMYPMLHAYLAVRPWIEDGPFILKVYLQDGFAATGTFEDKLDGLYRALYDYSFGLYSWLSFHGNYPIFGSLFTFALPALPFLRNAKGIWWVVLLVHLGIGVWFWFFHFERYLQTLLPWMAAALAAISISAWRTGLPARIGLVSLFALQLAWGLAAIFWPLHQMTGKSNVALAAEFLGRAYRNQGAATRVQPFEDFAALGRAVPRSSKVLVHHEHMRTGLGRMSVTDAPRIQYGLDYGELGSYKRIHDQLRAWGVTHVVHVPQTVYGDESVAAELLFHGYALSWQVVQTYGARSISLLPRESPSELPAEVLVHQCDGTYGSGAYHLSDLRVSPYSLVGEPKSYPLPREVVGPTDQADARYGYALVNAACPNAPTLGQGWRRVAGVSATSYYVRRAAPPP
jgi:hypothetical protein